MLLFACLEDTHKWVPNFQVRLWCLTNKFKFSLLGRLWKWGWLTTSLGHVAGEQMGIPIDNVNILMDLELIIENLSTSWLSLPVLSRNVTDIEETDVFWADGILLSTPIVGSWRNRWGIMAGSHIIHSQLHLVLQPIQVLTLCFLSPIVLLS